MTAQVSLRPRPETVSRAAAVAAVAGNAIEFYDFISYAFFAVYIGKTFFPTSSEYLSLLASVGVFGVGFVARPLGAWVIGAYADKRGRKPALLLTMTLMTVGTLGLALTPSYAAIGAAAPLLLVLARLIQGFALGGDVGPATAFLVENSPAHRRGLMTSLQLASQGIAAFVAGTLGALLTSTLTPAQMQTWGWRLPFVVALVLVPLTLYLRQRMPETLHGHSPVNLDSRGSAAQSRREQVRVVALGTFVIAGSTIATYVTTYMTSYATVTLKLPPTTAMVATVAVGLAVVAGALIGGWWSDRAGPAWPSLAPRIALAISAPIAFQLLVSHPSLATLVVVCALLGVLTATSGAASLHLLSERLGIIRRASGIALAYAAATTIFGSTTQAAVTWLIATTGSPMAPAWYASATSLASCLAVVLLLRPTRKQS